jgi:hypothetical protein
MIGHRPSALGIAQFCGLAPQLAEGRGAGRSAAVSTTFHMKCAADKDWQGHYDRLTDDEQAELEGWKAPEPVELGDTVLEYADAVIETAVGLTEVCGYCEPDDPNAMTAGTPDLYWFIGGVVYMADLKRSERTTPDGPRALQLAAYALAVCAKVGADAYCCGIWSLEEGLWEWGDLIMLDSAEGLQNWKRVRAAAMNLDPTPNHGAHCTGCWERMACPQWHAPPEHLESTLAPITEGGEITQENALALLLACEQVRDVEKHAREMLRHYADDCGGIVDPESGKIWKGIMAKGRASLDKKALEAEHPGLIEQFEKVGKPSKRYTWLKGG